MNFGPNGDVTKGEGGKTVLNIKHGDVGVVVSAAYDGPHDKWFAHVFLDNGHGTLTRISDVPTQ